MLGTCIATFAQETYWPLFIKAIDEQPLERKIPRCQDYQRIASGAPPQMDRGLYHNPLNCRSISTGKKPLTPRPILWCPYFWTHHCNGNSDVLQTMGIRFFLSENHGHSFVFFHREKTIS
jgi:hypothetical protein